MSESDMSQYCTVGDCGQVECEKSYLEAQLAAKDALIAGLVGAVRDADHLCRWLLQSDISEEDREGVIRENGINFALALAAPKEGK